MCFTRLALMLLAFGVLPQRARAEPARFSWRGPACAEGAPQLELRLAELVAPQELARLGGRVSVTRDRGRYAVELSIDLDGRALGARRFEVESCARAAETAAVAASLAVYDGEDEPAVAAASGISPDIWTRRPDPTPDFSRPPPPSPPPEPRLEARLGMLGVVELGALREPAWGGGLELGLGLGKRWSLSLSGSATASQRRALREQQAVALSVRSAGARVCAAPLRRDLYRLDGCAGARLVQARGEGQGFDFNRSATLLWAAPLLGLDFSLRKPRFLEWRCELEGSVPLTRRRFLVDGSEVSRAAAITAALRLGAVWSF
jgi:hypothetical protein